MKKVFLIYVITVLTLFTACAGPGSGSTEERDSSDIPDWFMVVPTAEDTFYRAGQAKKQNPTLARQTATARARAEISQMINVKVSSMLKDFMQESGVGDNAQALEFTESVTKQVTDNVLKGSIVKETYVAKDGTIFVLVEYPLVSVRQAALGAAKQDEALYNEFKANQAFDSLEREIQKLDTK